MNTNKTTAALRIDRDLLAPLAFDKGWEWARFAVMDIDRELATR